MGPQEEMTTQLCLILLSAIPEPIIQDAMYLYPILKAESFEARNSSLCFIDILRAVIVYRGMEYPQGRIAACSEQEIIKSRD